MEVNEMENKFEQLVEPITLPNGVTLQNRLAMAPMVVKGANEDGTISELDLAYFGKRSDVAGMIITGAAYVNEMACGFAGQISISKDEDIEGLKKLAAVAKKDGNKAIVQLHHAGREGLVEKLGRVVAPSALNFSFLKVVPEELTAEEIEETIKDFGRAAKRALEAGFDGVEIHGANHYLLQQFFSAFSNQRNDEYGGSLEKRMSFPLAVVKEVRRVVTESGRKDFIVGYRICPDEIHGDTVGYTLNESLQLIDRVVEAGVDYLHISIFTGYQTAPEGMQQSYGQQIKVVVNERCPVMIVSTVFTAEDALDALNHGDIVAIGRAAIVEPQFARKVREGREEEIATSVENRLETLAIPDKAIEWFTMDGSPLPPLSGLNKQKEELFV
jgi:2,4-dienoyl-CoA reductase-like NADH-dependent reductase (Old Yellow Enzyme family)